MPSRSTFFFNRLSAFSTDSPFLSLISVNADSLPLRELWASADIHCPLRPPSQREGSVVLAGQGVNLQSGEWLNQLDFRDQPAHGRRHGSAPRNCAAQSGARG